MGGSIYNYIGLGVYPGNLKVEVHDNYNVGGAGFAGASPGGGGREWRREGVDEGGGEGAEVQEGGAGGARGGRGAGNIND